LGDAEVSAANALATNGLVPDLTVLLELPAGLGLERAEKRGAKDRMERAGTAFLQSVADAFSSFATTEWQQRHPEAGPIVTVNAVGSPDEVEQRVLAAVAARIPELAARVGQKA
jgi:dTMP kinase